MKEIQSAGGPLIGLDRDHLELWTGIWGKKFIGNSAPFRNDYEAAGYLTDGRAYPPRNIAEIIGVSASGILMTVPNHTCVLDINHDTVYLVQIDYCEPEWNYCLIGRDDFEKACFDAKDNVIFSCKSCNYVLFDAAYAGKDCRDDCLTFDLRAGKYVFSTAFYKPNDVTGLILCKITRVGDTAP